MSPDDFLPSDVAILDLLRKHGSMTVTNLGGALGVTSTAVRQRLTRLLAQGYIQRETVRSASRGRPNHRYALTDAGKRKTGANFADLSLALWQEIRAIKDPAVRQGLLERISRRLAAVYQNQVTGETVEARMSAVVDLFAQRRIPLEVVREGGLPVLQANACPYPTLAEQDRAICAMERLLFSELLGQGVRLERCRLDGDSCCTFELQ